MPLAAVARTATHSAELVVFRPVTTTVGPVVRLSEIRSDPADQVIVWSARAGVTVAPMVAPGPPVRMDDGLFINAMRNGRFPCPADSYLLLTPAGSQSSAGAFGAARSRFHGLKAGSSCSDNSLEYVNAGAPTVLS